MSKLEQLIAELCPDGVEYKSLGDVCHYSKTRIEANCLDASSYVGVDNLLQDKQGKVLSNYVPTEGRLTEYISRDILIGNIRPYLRKIWRADAKGGTNGDVLVMRVNAEYSSMLVSEFLYYVLSSERFFLYDIQNSKGAKMPRGNKEAIMRYAIPLPPLPIQREIVRILDNFTELTAELTAELTTRKKQYEYYRNELLTFGDDVPMVALGEISSIGVGQSPEEIDGGSFPFVNAGTTPSGYLSCYNTESDTITTPSRGQGGIGYVGYQTSKFWCGPLCYRIRSIDGRITTRFLYHIMANSIMNIIGLAHMAGVPALNRKELVGFFVPLPPLAEQTQIVSILDKFDTLTTDITSGLPAEIEARNKQYEYYRDKLLTFKEAGV